MWITCLRYYEPDSSESYAAVNREKPLCQVLSWIWPPSSPLTPNSRGLRLSPCPHLAPCPNPCPAINKAQLSSTGARWQKGASLLRVGVGWAALGVSGDGETGDRRHREKRSSLSPWQAPARRPGTIPCSGSLSRSPQAGLHQRQQSCVASPWALGTGHHSAGHHAPLAQEGIQHGSCIAANSKQGPHNFFVIIKFSHSFCLGFW